MTYRVELTRAAARQVKRLPAEVRERILARLEALAEDPRPAGVRKLAGTEDGYRVRVGAYRVLYRVEDDRLVVLVVRVSHRREAYR